jgi:hypothetical protein
MPTLCALAVCVHLINVSAAPPALVADAQRQLTGMFTAIGVELRWTDAPGSILLVLRDDEPGELHRASQPILGAAVHASQGTPAAYVFIRRAAEQADLHAVARAAILACAMAHEIAHLLLPASGHARSGLMRGCWDDEEFVQAARGDLRLLPNEAASIRARVER